MKILAVECSATAASCCIYDGGKLISEYFTNTKTTHSATLMPMIKNMLELSETELSGIDLLAVSNGPGSFTGVRIGVSAIKGLAFANDIKCIGVSSLEAMAHNLKSYNCTICATMDARCSQVYNAMFLVENGNVTRLCEDRAVSLEDLHTEISQKCELTEYQNLPIIVVGDGAELFYNYCAGRISALKLAEPNLRYNRASGVGLAALSKSPEEYITGTELLPLYLRPSQAERELKKKLSPKTED